MESKRQTQEEKALQMLRFGPVTYTEFKVAFIFEYRSIINKLRKKDHQITDERWDGGKRWTLHEGGQRELFAE